MISADDYRRIMEIFERWIPESYRYRFNCPDPPLRIPHIPLNKTILK
jgi:hypothetical protein